jgi:hypothetical protein
MLCQALMGVVEVFIPFDIVTSTTFLPMRRLKEPTAFTVGK